MDHGAYYAAKSMLDHHSKRILWGWIPERRPEAEHRAAGWAGAMALPRVLSLSKDGSLQMEPAEQVVQLHGNALQVRGGQREVAHRTIAQERIRNLAADLTIQFSPQGDRPFRLDLRSEHDEPFVEIVYQNSALRVNRTTAPLEAAAGEPIQLRLLLDGSVLELFANKTLAITERVYQAPATPLRMVVGGGQLDSLDLWEMQPISRDRLTS